MPLLPTRKQAVITFLMSPQGQRLLREAYRRLDTPANRLRAQQALETLRARVPRRPR